MNHPSSPSPSPSPSSLFSSLLPPPPIAHPLSTVAKRFDRSYSFDSSLSRSSFSSFHRPSIPSFDRFSSSVPSSPSSSLFPSSSVPPSPSTRPASALSGRKLTNAERHYRSRLMAYRQADGHLSSSLLTHHRLTPPSSALSLSSSSSSSSNQSLTPCLRLNTHTLKEKRRALITSKPLSSTTKSLQSIPSSCKDISHIKIDFIQVPELRSVAA